MNTKIVKLPADKFPDRLPLETCKQVLKAKENGYSDEEVLKIRDVLYALADIDYEYFQENKHSARIIELNNYQDETQSHSLHPGLNRRAS